LDGWEMTADASSGVDAGGVKTKTVPVPAPFNGEIVDVRGAVIGDVPSYGTVVVT
jgi:hypothetical protein